MCLIVSLCVMLVSFFVIRRTKLKGQLKNVWLGFLIVPLLIVALFLIGLCAYEPSLITNLWNNPDASIGLVIAAIMYIGWPFILAYVLAWALLGWYGGIKRGKTGIVRSDRALQELRDELRRYRRYAQSKLAGWQKREDAPMEPNDEPIIAVAENFAKQSGFMLPRGVKLFTAALGLGLLLLLIASMCIRVVPTSHLAVITTFGEVSGVANTGLHFKLPWQEYNLIDLSVQTDVAEYATATKDSQNVSQEVTIRWQVEPDKAAELFKQYLGYHKQGLFDAVKGDSVKEGSATLSIAEYIPKREALRTAMQRALDQSLAGSGIRIVGVDVSNIVLPEGFEQAIADRQIAEEEKRTSQIRQEKAEIDAVTNQILAESYAKPEFFKIEWLKKWNGTLPDTLVIGTEEATTVFPLQ